MWFLYGAILCSAFACLGHRLAFAGDDGLSEGWKSWFSLGPEGVPSFCDRCSLPLPKIALIPVFGGFLRCKHCKRFPGMPLGVLEAACGTASFVLGPWVWPGVIGLSLLSGMDRRALSLPIWALLLGLGLALCTGSLLALPANWAGLIAGFSIAAGNALVKNNGPGDIPVYAGLGFALGWSWALGAWAVIFLGGVIWGRIRGSKAPIPQLLPLSVAWCAGWVWTSL